VNHGRLDMAPGGEARYKEQMGSREIYPMLVIDAGNTSVKFARVARRHAVPRIAATVATFHLTAARVKKIVRESESRTVLASCVVPAARRILRAGYPGVSFINKATRLNFSTSVDRRTVGADRLANMAEAARRFGRSVVVADFGTAATFDRLDGRGCFAGGAIAPGLRVLARALSGENARLPVAELAAPRRAAGRDTREALRSGVTGGYGGMVRHLLRELPARHVVFTGGDAALLAKLTGARVTIDPLGTLKGIRVLADLAAREASK
jgi:pantothenate kinase type III